MPISSRWSPGDAVVLRYVSPLMLVGKPELVVEDCPERVVVYVPNGAQVFGSNAPAERRAEPVRAFARGELTVTGRLILWRNHLLRVLLPGWPFSV